VTADLTVRGSTSFLETNEDLILYLRTLPRGSVIASDPKTAYALSAFTEHQFVAIYGQHANPFDPLAMPRLQAARDILNPWSPAPAVVSACERFQVDFVVCNGRTQTQATEFLALWDVSFYEPVVSRLSTFDERFRQVWAGDDVVVFLHDPAGGDGIAWSGPPAPVRFDTGTDEGCRVRSPGDEYRLASIVLDSDTAAGWDELGVEVVYEKAQASRFGFPNVVHIRFDHESLDHDSRYPGEKFVRRWRERRAGTALRFRADRIAYGGLFPRDYWPIGRRFSDRFPVYVHSDVIPGSYNIEVSIETQTLLPNFTIADLLFNRDHYSGTRCGTLTVPSEGGGK